MPLNHGAATQGSTSSLRSASAYTGAIYNLNERYEKKLDERFKTKAYTEAAANNGGYSWAGVNAITIETTGVGRMNAYDFSATLGSRMGTMHEISDQINTYKLKQYYSIRETYEKLYSDDKINERKIQRILKDIMDEVLVPAIDTYRLKTWADNAATFYGPNTSGTYTAISTSNIVKVLLDANAKLDNLHVPTEGRLAFISISDAVTMQLADELKYQQEFTNKGAINGAIRKLGRTTVVAVPDNLMPAGVKILIKYKKASVDVRKLSWSHVYPHVEGYSGPVLNGLYRYDSFVLAQKANGIMVIGDSTAAPQAAPTLAYVSSGSKVTMTSTTWANGTASKNATNVFYTVDGHNPKIVDNGTAIRMGGTATSGVLTIDAPTADCYISAYAEGSNVTASPIVVYQYVASTHALTKMADGYEVAI